jgi:PIN domain nuclease of toxin-antitoxin system
MNFLLDTHTLIWFFESDAQLSRNAKKLIEDPGNQNFFSVASVWEMVIKESIGKLELSKPVEKIISHIQQNGIELVEITHEHALKVGQLEYVHRDPFDRLIIAQSLCLNYSILGKDEVFDKYGVIRLW